MALSEADKAARLATKLADRQALCEQFNLTPDEYSILILVHYEDRPADLVVRFTKSFLKAMGYPLAPDDDYATALQSLLRRRYLQIITEKSLASITSDLRQDLAIGPTSGLPRIGTVHFTSAGLKLWAKLHNARNEKEGKDTPLFNISAAPVYNGPIVDVYAQTLCGAFRWVKDMQRCKILAVESIGRWRCYWWDEYPRGVRVRIELPYDSGIAPS